MLIERDPDEKVWVTYVPTLGQLSTYGDTRAEALEQTREAITGYLEAAARERLFEGRALARGLTQLAVDSKAVAPTPHQGFTTTWTE